MSDSRSWSEDDARRAFDAALADGLLSRDPTAPNYVAKYMWMCKSQGRDYFKHRDTRQYLVSGSIVVPPGEHHHGPRT